MRPKGRRYRPLSEASRGRCGLYLFETMGNKGTMRPKGRCYRPLSEASRSRCGRYLLRPWDHETMRPKGRCYRPLSEASRGLCGLSVPSVPLLSSVPTASSLPRCKYTTFEPPLSSILTIICSKLFRKMGLPTPTRLSQKSRKSRNHAITGGGGCVTSVTK